MIFNFLEKLWFYFSNSKIEKSQLVRVLTVKDSKTRSLNCMWKEYTIILHYNNELSLNENVLVLQKNSMVSQN